MYFRLAVEIRCGNDFKNNDILRPLFIYMILKLTRKVSHRSYINIPIIFFQKKNTKISIQVTGIGYFEGWGGRKEEKRRILLLPFQVFPDFIFVNIKRNFNYEKNLKDICIILFPVLKIFSYGIVFR
ncbi:unnamed protein product [Pipistrellus nathusii]|uniref:Uncharacterized protein n=1 Tax=Pipistrellus nathusii TaxID=59473 RepID=A0ABN9ZUI0_PIPNA